MIDEGSTRAVAPTGAALRRRAGLSPSHGSRHSASRDPARDGPLRLFRWRLRRDGRVPPPRSVPGRRGRGERRLRHRAGRRLLVRCGELRRRQRGPGHDPARPRAPLRAGGAADRGRGRDAPRAAARAHCAARADPAGPARLSGHHGGRLRRRERPRQEPAQGRSLPTLGGERDPPAPPTRRAPLRLPERARPLRADVWRLRSHGSHPRGDASPRSAARLDGRGRARPDRVAGRGSHQGPRAHGRRRLLLQLAPGHSRCRCVRPRLRLRRTASTGSAAA